MKIALSEREVPIREGSSYRESTVFCGCYGNSFANITNKWAAVELLIIFQIAFGHVKIQYRLILKLFYNECTHLKCRHFIIKKKNGSSRSACQIKLLKGTVSFHLGFKLRIFFSLIGRILFEC